MIHLSPITVNPLLSHPFFDTLRVRPEHGRRRFPPYGGRRLSAGLEALYS